MSPQEITKQANKGRFLIITAAFIIVVAGMRAAEAILIPVLLSAFIAIISAQPLFFLKRKGVPAVLALLIVITVVIGIGLIMAVLIGTSLNDLSSSLPVYQAHIQEKTTTLLKWLDNIGIHIPDKGLFESINPSTALNLVSGILNSLGKVLTNSFLILLTVIFILLEASGFSSKLRAVLPDPDRSFASFEIFIHNVQRYMAIKTWMSLATGIAISIWLAILGIDYPVMWGLLAFLLNYIPNIGSILAAVPAILLALIEFGTGTALLATLGYLVVNIVTGSIIEPRIMGRGLGLSTLVVFLSLVFWGWVFGPVGMLLSVPLTMILKIAFDSNEETRWIAVLLGSEVPAGDSALETPLTGSDK